MRSAESAFGLAALDAYKQSALLKNTCVQICILGIGLDDTNVSKKEHWLNGFLKSDEP